MESKRNRKENRTKDEIRIALEEEKAKACLRHNAHMARIDMRLKQLDQPTVPRGRKPSIKSVLDSAKQDFTAEEIQALINEARARKHATE